jgi:hypothetical protein
MLVTDVTELAMPAEMKVPVVMTLMLGKAGQRIPRAEHRQCRRSDRDHRELSAGSGSDADEMPAGRARRWNCTHEHVSVHCTVTNR